MTRRDELTELLAGFVGRIRESGDPAQAFAPAVTSLAADLARSMDETAPDNVEAWYVLGWLRWLQAEALTGEERQAAAGNALGLLLPAASLLGRAEFPAPLLPALGDEIMPQLAAMIGQASRAGNTAMLSEAVVIFGHVLAATYEDNPDLPQRLSLFGAALMTRFQLAGDERDLESALSALRDAVRLGARDRGLDTYLLNLCATLKLRHGRNGDPADLDEAIEVGRRAVAASEERDKLVAALTNLNSVLLTRFARTARREDLTEGTDTIRRAIATARPDDPNRPAMLNNLAEALRESFAHGGPASDLDEALRAARLAVQTGEGSLDAPMFASNLQRILRSKVEVGGSAEETDELISLLRKAVAADPDNSALATDFGYQLVRRNAAGDLDEAAALARRAVALTDSGEVHVLALVLLDRALSLGAPERLDEVIATRRAIVGTLPADDDGLSESLTSLAYVLLDRFKRTEDPRDLAEAEERVRAAFEVARTETDRAYCLSDICGVLFARYTHEGKREALDEAAAVARGVADQPLPPGVLLNLAHLLERRGQAAAELDDLDAAIALVRRAAAATAEGRETPPRVYIQLRASDIWSAPMAEEALGHREVLQLLGAYLLRRFEWTNVAADADALVDVRRQLVATADGANQAAGFASLSYALKARFLVSGNHSDLDEAVETGRRALALEPENGLFLVSLSDTGRIRFEHGGDKADLDEAIEMGRRATALPLKGSNRAQAWVNLSVLLRTRFARDRFPADIDDAVDAGRRALEFADEEDYDRPNWMLSYAEALITRFRRDARRAERSTEMEADRAEAIRVASRLAGRATASPRARIRGAKIGAWLAVEERVPGTEDLKTAADLLETAVHLIPEVAPRSMRRREQHGALELAEGFTDDAAAMALLAEDRSPEERAQRALSLLEAGRAVLLSQLLDTRGDLTDLRDARPELAARFTGLRELLDADDENADRIALAGELAATLREIRNVDGFGTFALPPGPAELRAAAAEGPIVTLNLAHGGHALLLTTEGVTALPLPGLTASAVIDQINTFHVALREAYDPDADRAAAQTVLSDVLKWLWDNVTGPVLDELGYHGTPADGEPWPRCWWAPGGYFSLLPLHAAGHHDDAGGRTVMDRVVSSYTPTIRSLRHARRRPSAERPCRSLIVAMPSTPGLSELRNVRAEAELLTGILPGAITLTEPEREQVLAELPRHAIAHFACHGSYDVENPAAGRLLLRDHERNPLTVGDFNAVNLDGARLAYLSACHTAVNISDTLLDEAMHLAGAVQAAGFPQVIGTLWELDDEVAVEITGDFYRGLAEPGGALDPGRAARSLHRAVRAQRDLYPATPSLWASHLHFGA
ncbi:CHAT domain-containing protein [Amycolatopsis acidicola]|uniref:CHAT domain-containing protein n=1 Tax=Amycolatopsis acidicola TaxID=2596893 RepID=A0A5N0V015_9PSEU|nr:CHAT domain-containing protein [Amycolatopsis acidicola]KAA9158558.1 CHAT domain-containing protein [Amycolatopsis acidicola]